MFGGAGLSRDGVMFARLDDDVIYLRVDDALQADLQAQGSAPRPYSMKRDGAGRDMGSWRLPETTADEPDAASAVAMRSLAAAIKRKTMRQARLARTAIANASTTKAPGKPAKTKRRTTTQTAR